MKPKYRLFIFTLAVTLLLLTLAACGGTQVDPAAALAEMQDKIPFSEELTPLDQAAVCKYYDVEETELTVGVASVGSGATAESAAAFQAVDGTAAQRVETALQVFLEDWIEGYSDYKPEEVPKLEEAVLRRQGNVVLFCVSADGKTAGQVIGDILG